MIPQFLQNIAANEPRIKQKKNKMRNPLFIQKHRVGKTKPSHIINCYGNREQAKRELTHDTPDSSFLLAR